MITSSMTKGERMNLRRVAVMAAGLALATSVLAGAVPASAVAPELHIKPGGQWTVEIRHHTGGCEDEIFSATGFDGNIGGDRGTFDFGGTMIIMDWTAGSAQGLIFTGTFTTKPVREYKGSFGGIGDGLVGVLVKGAVSTWHGYPC
jgi:hypothetical protein